MRYLTRLLELFPALAGIGSVLYPFLVYFGLPRLSPGYLVAVALLIGGLHLLRHRQRLVGLMPGWSFLPIPCILLGLLVFRPGLAPQAYPPLVNLGLAAIFARSLLYPPTVIESIARVTRPVLPPAGVAYARSVTKVWTIFFVANAAIASICAVWFTVAVWTLWTGVISYLLVGCLFAGEVLVRRWVLQQALP